MVQEVHVPEDVDPSELVPRGVQRLPPLRQGILENRAAANGHDA